MEVNMSTKNSSYTKSEISSKLKAINRRFDKWFNDANVDRLPYYVTWSRQKKYLTEELVNEHLLYDGWQAREFWRAFEAITNFADDRQDWDEQFRMLKLLIYLANQKEI